MTHPSLVCITGAGASVAAGVPAFREVWEAVDARFGFSNAVAARAMDVPGRALRRMYEAYEPQRGTDAEWDIEVLCTTLRERSRGLLRDSFATVDDLHTARGCVEAEYALRRTFVDLIDVDFDKQADAANSCVGAYQQLFDMSRGAMDVFTLNNDLLLEWGTRTVLRAPLVDGFNPSGILDTANWDVYRQARPALRMFKLHGSIDWYREEHRFVRMASPRSVRARLTRRTAADSVPYIPLVWPGVYDEMEEIRPLRDDFLRASLETAQCVLVIGYKMGDGQISQAVLEALSAQESGAVRKTVFIISGENYPKQLVSFLDALAVASPALDVRLTRREYGQSCGRFPDIMRSQRFLSELTECMTAP